MTANDLDTPGNRNPEYRYAGYKGDRINFQTATADQLAAYMEGAAAANQHLTSK